MIETDSEDCTEKDNHQPTTTQKITYVNQLSFSRSFSRKSNDTFASSGDLYENSQLMSDKNEERPEFVAPRILAPHVLHLARKGSLQAGKLLKYSSNEYLDDSFYRSKNTFFPKPPDADLKAFSSRIRPEERKNFHTRDPNKKTLNLPKKSSSNIGRNSLRSNGNHSIIENSEPCISNLNSSKLSTGNESPVFKNFKADFTPHLLKKTSEKPVQPKRKGSLVFERGPESASPPNLDVDTEARVDSKMSDSFYHYSMHASSSNHNNHSNHSNHNNLNSSTFNATKILDDKLLSECSGDKFSSNHSLDNVNVHERTSDEKNSKNKDRKGLSAPATSFKLFFKNNNPFDALFHKGQKKETSSTPTSLSRKSNSYDNRKAPPSHKDFDSDVSKDDRSAGIFANKVWLDKLRIFVTYFLFCFVLSCFRYLA
jgi:hypothetical protein